MEKHDRRCFVISPIGEPDTETRRRSDDVYVFIIVPCLEACGYCRENIFRGDMVDKPGVITSQIVGDILNAPLVVADLTDRNPNVFYELALRHLVRKPVVQISHLKNALPFDVASQRTVFYNHQDIRLTERDTKPRLIRQIQEAEKDGAAVDNPIVDAVDLQALRVSNNPTEELLVNLMAQVKSLHAAISMMRNDLNQLRYPIFGNLTEYTTVLPLPQASGSVTIPGVDVWPISGAKQEPLVRSTSPDLAEVEFRSVQSGQAARLTET